jgi:hypothetical protein
MSRVKTTILSSVVCILVAAIWSTSASASFEITKVECSGSGIPTACIELEGKLFEVKGEETYSGKLVPGTEILFTVPSIPIEVACSEDVSSGTISQLNPGVEAVTAVGTLKLKGCSLIGTGAVATKCAIPTEKTTLSLLGTVVDEMPIKAGKVIPASGTIIIEIPFSSKAGQTCPATVVGTRKVTGADTCFDPEAEVDKAVHVGECTKTGSELLFIEKAANFECKAEAQLSGENAGLKGDVTLS